jgi:hypothetical protein
MCTTKNSILYFFDINFQSLLPLSLYHMFLETQSIQNVRRGNFSHYNWTNPATIHILSACWNSVKSIRWVQSRFCPLSNLPKQNLRFYKSHLFQILEFWLKVKPPEGSPVNIRLTHFRPQRFPWWKPLIRPNSWATFGLLRGLQIYR